VARIRAVPEDFVVDELPLYPASGEGEHTFVRVEKRLRTTEEVATALARLAGIRSRDVGYAGRKDRNAVARQWLSVQGLDPEVARDFRDDGVRVLEAYRHGHKLRTGQLRGNRFSIAIREIDGAARAAIRERVAEIAEFGMPNRYGGQRFGRDGANSDRARPLLEGRTLRDRRQARFLLSALQASVFNDVLSERPIGWGTLETGDVAVVHASGGQFVVEDVEREAPRARAFEISPTGPIFGTKVIAPTGVVAEWERRVFEARGIPAVADWQLPRGVRLRGARRALRVRPAELALRELSNGDLSDEAGWWLDFTLPAGSYATVLVREVLGAEPLVGPPVG
jgi:tRNA pseudouridine13 synthase